MGDNSGYIHLHRQIRDNRFWKERREFSKLEAWLDILMEVRWQQEPCEVLIGMSSVTCGYGQSLKSMDTWAKRWKWSRSKVLRFLKLCEECSMICCETVHKTTRLTVCNYGKFQNMRTLDEHLMNTSRTLDEHLMNTEEERKELKKKTKTKVASAPLDFPAWLDLNLWNEFREHRKKLRKPMTPGAETILIRKIECLMKEGQDPREMLERAMERGWLSVFPNNGSGPEGTRKPEYTPSARPMIKFDD